MSIIGSYVHWGANELIKWNLPLRSLVRRAQSTLMCCINSRSVWSHDSSRSDDKLLRLKWKIQYSASLIRKKINLDDKNLIWNRNIYQFLTLLRLDTKYSRLFGQYPDLPTPDPAKTIRFTIWNHTILLQTIQFSDQIIHNFIPSHTIVFLIIYNKT